MIKTRRVSFKETGLFLFSLFLIAAYPLSAQVKSEAASGKSVIPAKTHHSDNGVLSESILKQIETEDFSNTSDNHLQTLKENDSKDKNLLDPANPDGISEDKSLFERNKIQPFIFQQPEFSASINNSKKAAGTSSDNTSPGVDDSFHWKPAIEQALLFLGIQHGFALTTQAKTRHALKGKFFKDYVDSVKSLHGWDDGGRFFTNYIAHPMQGSFTSFIFIQNDPKGKKQQFGSSGDYWRSRLKALAWSATWSTQFEIGPISQASIGNVGLKGKQTWGDIVTTPTAGFAMTISEDALDRFVVRKIERSTDNFYVKIFSRMLLSPTRTLANVFRFKEPWYRDRK